MKKRTIVATVICVMCALLLAGCTGAGPDKTGNKEQPENISEEADDEEPRGKEADEEEADGKEARGEEARDDDEGKKKYMSLAQRMAGKYSYHYSDDEGNDEFYIMDVVPFGDNLYAYCGQAMTEDYENLEAYTFWAGEFIPYDADEMKSTDADTVTVNELCFSIMSNAGMYWDAGHKGSITLTDDGLVFEGFDNEGFLVPDNDDSRLFLKDDRVEDAFPYLSDGKGDDGLEGLWILDRDGVDIYLRFAGANMYIYCKDPGAEVFYAAGGCDFSGSSFSCTASKLGSGGMPFELSCDYRVSGDSLTLKTTDSDMDDEMPPSGKYKRVREGKVHVTTMDEVELNVGSFGYLPENGDLEALKDQDYYGVFVASAKTPEGCEKAVEALEDIGGSITVYTPDFSELNPEPYYVVTTGLYTSKSDAEEALAKVKAAGFKDAYVKYAGSYTGYRYWYTMHDAGNIEILKDGVMLRGVSVSIPYLTYADGVVADLIVTDDAVFDKSAELEFFGNYEKGDTPREWIVRNVNLMNDDVDKYMMDGPALCGIFEVSLEGNDITAYYGSYWWD